MNKKKYFLWMISAVFLVLIAFAVLLYLDLVFLPLKLALLLGFTIVFQFTTAGVIATVGNMESPESFAQRFLILTTFQLVSVIAIFLAVKFSMEEFFKPFVTLLTAIFLILMIVQSVLLVKLGKALK